MTLSIWSAAILLSKLLLYLASAAVVGGSWVARMASDVAPWHLWIRRYLGGFAWLGLATTMLHFLLQVGAFAETGFTGMFSVDYVSLLWQSNVGDAGLYRVVGFTLVLCALALTAEQSLARLIMMLLAAVALARAFSLVGHSADLALGWQWLLSAHFLLVCWWFGALWPLYQSCFLVGTQALYRLMHQFGRQALVAVGLLLSCGVLLASRLLFWSGSAVNGSYAALLLLKLTLVCAILLLAARHKFRLAPNLLQQPDRAATALAIKRLVQSIRVEMGLAVAILLTTGALSTLLGPNHA